MKQWKPSNAFLAAEVHVCLGILFVLGPIALRFWSNPLFGLIAVLVVDVPKEYVLDRIVEGQDWKDGSVDLFFWLLGAGTGLLLFFLFVILKR
jgi:hypothetical protein